MLRFEWDIGEFCFFLKNSEYTCKQILTKSVRLDTPNSKYYTLHNKYNIKCELGKLQLTQYNQHTTDGEHSHMQTRHSFLVYNMADRSNRRYGDTLRHAAVWSSAKPTPHSTILRSPTNIHGHQLRLRLTLPNTPPVFSAPTGGDTIGISWRCLMLVKLE